MSNQNARIVIPVTLTEHVALLPPEIGAKIVNTCGGQTEDFKTSLELARLIVMKNSDDGLTLS